MNVKIDGQMIFREAFENSDPGHIQTYIPAPGVSLARSIPLGFTGGTDCALFFCDAAYDLGFEPAFQNIPHTSNSLTVEWFTDGAGWQGIDDESWAIDNVEVLVVNESEVFATDALIWHQPLARNGASDDTDPSAGGTIKYRFKRGSTIPIQVHVKGCAGDVTSNANVVGSVAVFADSNCEGATDASAALIEFNGIGSSGGDMEKVGDHLKYNLDTKTLPTDSQCFVLRVNIADTMTGQTVFEEVLLQAK